VDGASPSFAVTGGALTRAPDLVLDAGATISLRVTDPDGRPLEGARVEVNVDRAVKLEWDFMESWRNEAEARTDASGRARIEHLAEGRVTLAGSHAQFAAARRQVDVRPGEAREVDVTLALRATMTLAGRVRDADGKPLAALVTARGVDEAGEDEASAVSGRADAEGRFRLERVPRGPATVRASADGHRSGLRRVDGPTEDIELVLERASSDPKARLAEIRQTMAELAGRMRTAGTNEERRELARQIQLLNEELQRLTEADGGADDGPPRSEPVPPEHGEGEGSCG
jgi:hypothetical protein